MHEISIRNMLTGTLAVAHAWLTCGMALKTRGLVKMVSLVPTYTIKAMDENRQM